MLGHFFAHSNFTDWRCGSGLDKIDPRVPISGNPLPLTTGALGGPDTLVTLMLEIGGMVKEFDAIDPGSRSTSKQIFSMLHRDEYPEAARLYRLFLSGMEECRGDHTTHSLLSKDHSDPHFH